MLVSQIFIRLSFFAGLLTALVSLLGIAQSNTYAKETVNWAGQAMAQDYVNLFIVFPVLLISIFCIKRNSLKAFLVWLGLLLYLIYSYILYSFFIHFGPLFLLYVAILGLSFYSFVGALATLKWQDLEKSFATVNVKPASALLAVTSILFYFLWLSDIFGALLNGRLPQDLDKIGLFVNPIQVLDLAFLLPGALIVSVLLWRKKIIGLVLAVPIIVFFIAMGVAIIAIMIVLAQKGFSLPIPPLVMMGGVIGLSLTTALGFLKRVVRNN